MKKESGKLGSSKKPKIQDENVWNWLIISICMYSSPIQPITTYATSSNPIQVRCTRYNAMG
jgi:hypothetical protein